MSISTYEVSAGGDGDAPTSLPPRESLRSRIVNGSLILLLGSGLVSVVNLAYNVAIARLLGPVGFANATAVYTLLMLLSAISLSFQIVCAKLVASHTAPGEKAAIYSALHRRAWGYAIAIGLLLVLARNLVSSFLNLPGTQLIVLLALGVAFYIPLGARRGSIQGRCAFNMLAMNFILEGFVRLGGAYTLVKLGMGVTGAVLASVAGVVLAYLFAGPRPEWKVAAWSEVPVSFREGLQAIVFFAGQVVINNFDIVLVKHFFLPAEAGLYAAVALVGRAVNMCAWSVTNSMFPVSAETAAIDAGEKRMLSTSVLLVVLILTCLILGLWLMPSFIWRSVFGARFEVFGQRTISSLLMLYAVTSVVYALSSVIIAYEMSRRLTSTAWVQFIFSGLLVATIYRFHNTLHQVVQVQLELLIVLLVIVLLPFLRASLGSAYSHGVEHTYGKVRKRRRLTADEVIAEFLRNEFPHPEFDDYRMEFEPLVHQPNLESAEENDARRALLFVRRGPMWRELPPDVQWFEVELNIRDLARIRVFPRAQWRRIAQGDFQLTTIVERIRTGASDCSDSDFFRKLDELGTLIPRGGFNPTVLLIGTNERSPLTILDGNHRLTAAMLRSPAAACASFRFVCGFSPAMVRCCWYQTNMLNLWRYATNLVRYMSYDPESALGRFLDSRP